MVESFSKSPFHAGERRLQARAGRRDAVEAFGSRAIRSFMPDEHRELFERLPFAAVGAVDDDGWPWATILAGAPGFMSSPDPKRLNIAAAPLPEDPLAGAIREGAQVGLLGVDLATRRRNRLNARVVDARPGGFGLAVDQSFGNCPRYIQTRGVDFVRDPGATIDRPAPDRFVTLDAEARARIAAADAFFVTSFVAPKDDPAVEGVDVSHRGGRPGFVKVVGDTLTIPDFSGNFMFNTLGNFLTNPKAGIVFPDFATGDALMLTGTVELLLDDDPEIAAFAGAERGWRFTLDHGLRIRDAAPFRAEFREWSPHSLKTGDWRRAAT